MNIHGYLRTKKSDFIPVNAPGHTNTIVQRILPDGTLLGCRHDGDNMASMKGITIGRRGYELAEGQFIDITEAGGVRLRPWSIRWATTAQLDEMAAAVGMTLIDRWEAFDRTPCTADSERQVSVFCKGSRANSSPVRPSREGRS